MVQWVCFLVQNAKRLEIEGSGPFVPTDLATLGSSNVLDQRTGFDGEAEATRNL